MQQRHDQGERGERGGHRIQQLGFAGGDDPVHDEAEGDRGKQHDQADQQPGRHEARDVGGEPLPGEPQQLSRSGRGGGERPIEQPCIGLEGAGAFGVNPRVAPAGRVHLPVAPERARQQGDRPAVILPVRQHRPAVANPPPVRRGEPYPPAAHAGRIQNVAEGRSGVGFARRDGPFEVNPLMTPDRLQSFAQRRNTRAAVPLPREPVQVEQTKPGPFLIAAAIGGPFPRDIRLVDDREAAVEPLKGERRRMEACERGQQKTLLGERFG